MLDRSRILALIPHQGAMCLLDDVTEWTPARILCHTRSHLDPANPLRRQGRLGMVCGLEYALQAAALHGALLAGETPQPAGYLAALRDVALHTRFLDDPTLGTLQVEATLEQLDTNGLIYTFRLTAETGTPLASGRGTIALRGQGA
jgi:predicted hotdog family 3-hydroxylacyl-ACP dehydratase